LRSSVALIAGWDRVVVILPRLVAVALVATTSPSMHDARFSAVSPRFQVLRRTARRPPGANCSALDVVGGIRATQRMKGRPGPSTDRL
jgi:hypothetical protein